VEIGFGVQHGLTSGKIALARNPLSRASVSMRLIEIVLWPPWVNGYPFADIDVASDNGSYVLNFAQISDYCDVVGQAPEQHHHLLGGESLL
jgi:hypothetical protein